MNGIKEGDEVRIFDANGRRMGQPEGGWPGHVTKVGRTLAHIEYRGATGTFRLSDGIRNDRMQHQRFKTMEQAALDERMRAAKTILREHRVTLEFGHKLTLEQIEALAEVARTFGSEEQRHG